MNSRELEHLGHFSAEELDRQFVGASVVTDELAYDINQGRIIVENAGDVPVRDLGELRQLVTKLDREELERAAFSAVAYRKYAGGWPR